MTNQNVSCFYTIDKSFKHDVNMKIKLCYSILVHSWSEIFEGNNQAYIGPIFHSPIFLMTVFLVKPIFRTFVETVFYVSSFFII